jgi:hypothetical protein
MAIAMNSHTSTVSEGTTSGKGRRLKERHSKNFSAGELQTQFCYFAKLQKKAELLGLSQELDNYLKKFLEQYEHNSLPFKAMHTEEQRLKYLEDHINDIFGP